MGKVRLLAAFLPVSFTNYHVAIDSVADRKSGSLTIVVLETEPRHVILIVSAALGWSNELHRT